MATLFFKGVIVLMQKNRGGKFSAPNIIMSYFIGLDIGFRLFLLIAVRDCRGGAPAGGMHLNLIVG